MLKKKFSITNGQKMPIKMTVRYHVTSVVIKMTVRYHVTSVLMSIMKKTRNDVG